MIEIKNLSYQYENREKQVLKDLNLTVNTGEFLCVIGHSGCGKSTLVSLLGGLLSPNFGTISIHGIPVTGPGTDRAVVFQQYSLFPWLKVLGNVEFAVMQTARYAPQECGERSAYFLRKVGLGREMDKYPYQLSGGMRQRTAIARALAMGSDILLLDEPFGALDFKIRSGLQRLLRRLWEEEKKTVIFVTHDLDEALVLATRIVFLKDGAIAKTMEVPAFINSCCACGSNIEECRNYRESLEKWYNEN